MSDTLSIAQVQEFESTGNLDLMDEYLGDLGGIHSSAFGFMLKAHPVGLVRGLGYCLRHIDKERMEQLRESNEHHDAWSEQMDAKNDRIADLTAALAERDKEIAALKAESEWRDISTAPKDGTLVLTWDGKKRCIESYDNGGWGLRALIARLGEEHEEQPEPTHYMPLPPEPKESV